METSQDGESIALSQAWTSSKSKIKLSDTAVVISLCMSTKYITISLDDKTIRVFGATGETVNTLTGSQESVWSLALNDDMLLSGEVEGAIRFWDLNTGQCTKVMAEHTKTVRCLELIDSETAISASSDATLKVWDLKTGTCSTTFHGHGEGIRALVLSGEHAISGSLDGTCIVWSLVEKKFTAILVGHSGPVYSLAANAKRVFSGGADHEIRVWDLVTGECESVLRSHTSLVTHLQLRYDLLVAAGADGRITIWSSDDLRLVQDISGAHQNAITSLQVESYILSGSSDGTAKVWDLQKGVSLGTLVPSAEAVWKVGFVQDTKRTAVLSKQGDDACLEVSDASWW